MKICLVHEEYPDETNYGGIATYQKRLATSLVDFGFEVTVITRSLDKDKEYIENGVRVIRIYNKETKDIYSNYYNYREKVANKLKELQDNNEIDLIEVPDWGAETILFEPFRKVPLIVRLHTPLAIWSKANKSKLDPAIHRKMLLWEKKMINSADKVTSCTNILKDLVVKELKLTRNDIEVIPNPANLKDFYLKKRIRNKSSILYCGSIEQRKGVILFANALPIVFKELGNVKIIFVGKDTTRNDKEISTIEYIKEIVPSKYHKNLVFKGQIDNGELNNIYNSSAIGVYPSLFDNFPYVVLESMACGLPFVGSLNSGMKEMLDNNTKYLYDAKSSIELATKIITLYKNKPDQKEMSKFIIDRIKNNYDSKIVIDKFVKLYNTTINEYNEMVVKEIVSKKIKKDIIELSKLEGGLANYVYLVTTKDKKYVVKLYKKNIDKKAIDKLINISKKHNIKVIDTIDNSFYTYRNMTICIYDYVEGKHIKKLTNVELEKILDFIKLNKKVDGSKYTKLIDKVNFYYESLRTMETKKIKRDLIDELLRKYMKLQNYNIFYEEELIHGDLTPNNILWTNDDFTLIDLDESTVFTKLYDLIVFAIKFSKDGKKIDIKTAKRILKPFDKYTKVDIINIWNFYILKVILEKIYLYEIGKIDLKDENQMKDNFEDWLYILNSSVIEDILNK